MNETETKSGDYRIITKVIPKPIPEPNKLIIELSNLSEGSLRTIKRELKVLIEDYGYKKMVSECIQVKDTEKAIVFVQHIENHLKDTGQFVMCKICGKTINEIYEEEGK